MKGIKKTKMWENKEKKRIKWNVPELLLDAVIILLAPLDPLGGRVWFIPSEDPGSECGISRVRLDKIK